MGLRLRAHWGLSARPSPTHTPKRRESSRRFQHILFYPRSFALAVDPRTNSGGTMKTGPIGSPCS